MGTTRGACNPCHQVAITYAQHLFGLPLRINGPSECIEPKTYSVEARIL